LLASIGVNKQSTNQAAALKFIAWLGTADVAQWLTDTLTGYFPLADHPVKINDPCRASQTPQAEIQAKNKFLY